MSALVRSIVVDPTKFRLFSYVEDMLALVKALLPLYLDVTSSALKEEAILINGVV